MLFLICDDKKQITDYIETAINNKYHNQVKTITFTSASEAVKYITNVKIPDAVIIDICVGEENGIAAIKNISDIIKKTPVIFITGYYEYCQDIFLNFKPFALITKPIDENKILYHIDKIIRRKLEENKAIDIIFNRCIVSVNTDEITYIESMDRKTIYHLENRQYEEYIKLDAALSKLSRRFIKSHKSYAVNVDYIKSIQGSTITIRQGITIPISRKFKDSFRKSYFAIKSEMI